jgi:hypothetical protein
MRRNIILTALLVATGIFGVRYAVAGQAPAAASDPDIPISHQDRVYSAEQFSNTVSVTDPVDNKLVGTIRLGDPLPANLSPLYKGQLLVHGMGFSPDHRTIAVVAIGSNAVNFIDTATNSVKHVTYVGRSPHEAFFTTDGKEVWVVVRGENYVSVLDGTTYEEKARIIVQHCWSVGGTVAGAAWRKKRGQSADQRVAIRPGVGAGAGGRSHWSRAGKAISACACE